MPFVLIPAQFYYCGNSVLRQINRHQKHIKTKLINSDLTNIFPEKLWCINKRLYFGTVSVCIVHKCVYFWPNSVFVGKYLVCMLNTPADFGAFYVDSLTHWNIQCLRSHSYICKFRKCLLMKQMETILFRIYWLDKSKYLNLNKYY